MHRKPHHVAFTAVFACSLACGGVGEPAIGALTVTSDRLMAGHFEPGDSRRISGEHVAGLVSEGKSSRLVIDGAPVGEPWAKVQGLSIAGSRWAVGGKNGAGEWRVVADGTAGAAFDQVGPPVVGADGRAAYVAADRKGQRLVRWSGKKEALSDAFDEVRIIAYDQAPKLVVAWAARRGERWHLGLDETIDLRTGWAKIGAATVGGDGRAAWAVKGDEGWTIVHGDRSWGPYANAGAPAVAPDAARVAWGAEQDGAWHVLVDGVSVGTHDRIGEPGPAFSPDGRLAWWAEDDGTRQVFVEGQPFGGTWSEIADLEIATAGDRVAWVAETPDGWSVVVNGEVLSTHSAVFQTAVESRRLALSDDGRYLAWVSPDEMRHYWLYVADLDAGRIATHDAIAGLDTDVGGGVVFTGDGLRFTSLQPDGSHVIEALAP